ncbi:MAG: CDP-glycerol glycerophosphotransferase family protein [Treponema sp.]|nr:CDP-glycerol glycerophosphotransferase family protein [Treponema sp.]
MFLLYIDPGTGSMLFSVFIGIVSALVFLFRKVFIKIKFVLSGGKIEKISAAKIPYVIFTDHKRYWNIFKPVCDEFERRGVELAYWTASPDDPALLEKYQHVKAQFIGEGNKAFAKLNMMNACIVLSTTPGLDVYQWKRSKNVDYYVHIRHTVDDPLGYRMFGYTFYDAILLSGDFQEDYIKKLEAARNEPKKEVAVVGCTYMDQMANRLQSEPKPDNAVPVVLLAPSWGPSAILAKFGSKILDALIATGYKIIVRPHPQSFTSDKDIIEPLMERYPNSERIEWNRDNDNFAVLNQADLMITDFSGIIFDYTLVFDKPIIYADTSFDKAPYDAAWIDEPLWRFSVLSNLGLKLQEADFPNIKQIIQNLLTDDSFAQGRKRVREQAWQFKGEGAKRTVDYLQAKYKELRHE